MQQQVGVNIQQYLDALHEIEKECASEYHTMCSASLILHPSGSGAVELDFLLTKTGGVAVDFDTEDGDDIMEAIHRLAEKMRQAF